MKNNQSIGLLVLRVGLGVLMLLHGIAKLKGVDGVGNMLVEKGIPKFFAYGVYLGEILAPLMLIIGFRTRVAALLVTCTMLVVIFIAHSENVLALSKTGGWANELPGLFLIGVLTLLFTGGGKFALSSKNKWD